MTAIQTLIENAASAEDSSDAMRYSQAACNVANALCSQAHAARSGITDEQIDHMVDRFLSWELPKDFAPDAGVSFAAPSNPELWPAGTNLLTATQAREMVCHIIYGLPKP